MKLLLIYCLLLSNIALAQKNKKSYKKVKDSSMVALLNNITVLKEFNTKTLFVRILESTNESGSAGFENCEVTSNIYIAVSEDGEYPKQNLFLIPSLYAPSVESIKEENGKIVLRLNYIDVKKVRLQIEIALVKIKIDVVKE